MKKIMLSILGALSVWGCASQKSVVSVDVTGQWFITQAMGVPTDDAETTPFINFDKDGSVNGNASVNTFFGSYKLSGTSLSLSNIGMTKMMGASMNVEDAITNALNSVASIKVENGNASLLNSKDEVVMLLSRKPEPRMTGATTRVNRPMPGAYGEYRTPNETDLSIFNSTYNGEVALTPQKVSSQVVAGVNLRFVCKDKDDNTYEVVIFKPLPGQGEAKVSSVEKK